MTDQNPTSALSLALLGIISRGEVSGYDIRKIFLTTPMGHFSASPGAIYPALKRFEENGLIVGSVRKEHTLRPKRTYRLTIQGQRRLENILSQPVTSEDVIRRLEEMVLRFAFMGEVLGQTRSLRFLEDLAVRIAEYLPVLRENLRIQHELKNPHGAYALEHGISKYRATAQWAQRVAENITREMETNTSVRE